jgi:lipoic acid synthetase
MATNIKQSKRLKPDWLKIKLPKGKSYINLKEIVKAHKLNTICTSGHCPNMEDCWGRGTATIMILGDICTRACRFCKVKTGRPKETDYDEPRRIAESIKLLKLKHVVLTSVDRDDLADGGASIWAETINRIKEAMPETTIEALIPDFQGNYEDLKTVMDSKPELISHNLETVRSLTPKLRSRAKYDTSLGVIKNIGEYGIVSKSGIMVGIGETQEEVLQTMDDLRKVDCQVLTVGQYLRPTDWHFEVKEYVHPDVFEIYRKSAIEKGFRHVESGPLVRSSYQAEKHIT